MMVCHNASSALFFDVVRGRHTEVTALFELDMNLRELRTQAKSLHFWSTLDGSRSHATVATATVPAVPVAAGAQAHDREVRRRRRSRA